MTALLVLVLSMSTWAQVTSSATGAQARVRAAAAPADSPAGTPELSTTSRLQDRREVAAAGAMTTLRSFERRKPAHRPLPEQLPRERIVYPASTVRPCCGGVLHKLGEDVTEML